MNRYLSCALFIFLAVSQASASSSTLPSGAEFPSWEKPLHFTHTYFVNGQAANADDNGPGTEQRPFRTIGGAAQILKPGERVVIAEGVYREFVRPARGGAGLIAAVRRYRADLRSFSTSARLSVEPFPLRRRDWPCPSL